MFSFLVESSLDHCHSKTHQKGGIYLISNIYYDSFCSDSFNFSYFSFQQTLNRVQNQSIYTCSFKKLNNQILTNFE